MDRAALADFLRRRREALAPEDVGLPTRARRRTPGLRREDVASLAHVSVDFYTRLEQGRGARPSEQTAGAIARALRLTGDERDHLYRLAGHVAPPRGFRSEHVSPALARLVERLDEPASVVSDLGVTLLQNSLSRALLGDATQLHGPARSLYWRWFTGDPATRIHPECEWPMHARSYVADLRSVLGRLPDDPAVRELVDGLLAASPEFAGLWERHEVAVRDDQRKTILHPVVGPITLDCQILTAQNPSERLVVFSARPGSEDADKIALLRVIGTQRFAPAAEPARS
jgi:transcriptional regulator with XRE-family HTH domain